MTERQFRTVTRSSGVPVAPQRNGNPAAVRGNGTSRRKTAVVPDAASNDGQRDRTPAENRRLVKMNLVAVLRKVDEHGPAFLLETEPSRFDEACEMWSKLHEVSWLVLQGYRKLLQPPQDEQKEDVA